MAAGRVCMTFVCGCVVSLVFKIIDNRYGFVRGAQTR